MEYLVAVKKEVMYNESRRKKIGLTDGSSVMER